MKVQRVFSVSKELEGWTLFRMEKDENGVWKNLPPIICRDKRIAQAVGREWRLAIRPIRRKK